MAEFFKRSRKLKTVIYLLIAVFVVIIAFFVYLAWRGTGFYIISPEQTSSALSGKYQYSQNEKWYTIDNNAFGADNTGKNARETTDGINNALAWAKSQGYKNIKFAEGTYLIQCNWNDRFIAPTDGILIPSGLTLDLGTSVFQLEPNDYTAYCIFGVVDQSNVTILGGTLVGDRDKHVYSQSADSPTHEWGFGICITASSNILIQGVTIKNTTGDGIMLEGSYQAIADGGKISSLVRIYDCDISNCRRQGISVIGCSGGEIAENKIYDISGTDPQYGIDIEPELDHTVDNIMIHNNLIYGCRKGAIICNSGFDYSVYSNTCKGNNIIAVKCSNVKIHGNIIESSSIQVYNGTSGVEVYNNQFDLLSRLVIEK